MEHFDVVVVGAGLVGAAVAHDLSAAGARTLVVEAGPEPAAGVSRSNSGILHTGFDSTPGTFETEMILEQGKRWPALFTKLGIPYRVPGALLLATDEEQLVQLPALAENARINGVTTLLLDQATTRELEPRARSVGSLLVPGEAITDPYVVVRRLLSTGTNLFLGWRVDEVGHRDGVATVSGNAGSVSASYVVNCAGLYGDEVAGDRSFRISARRGEFAVFSEGSAELVRHILLPVPDNRTKGVLVFPTIYGHLCAGPSAIDQDDKEDWRPRQKELATVREKAAAIFPEVTQLECVDSWAGLRPVGHPHNYMVEWSTNNPHLLNVAAIRSTGLSACLGLSRHVMSLLVERGLHTRPTETASPRLPDQDEAEIPWWRRLNAMRRVTGPC